MVIVVSLGVSLALAQTNSGMPLIWFPIGAALGLMLYYGTALAPTIIASLVLGNSIALWVVPGSFGGGPVEALAIALFDGLLCVWVVRQVRRFETRAHGFAEQRAILQMVLRITLMVVLGAIPAGLLLLFLGTNRAQPFWYPASVIFLRSTAATALITPLVLTWLRPAKIHWNLPLVLEYSLQLVSLLFVGMLFLLFHLENWLTMALPFLITPFLLWSVFRFSLRETCTVSFLLTMIVLLVRIQGLGSFRRLPLDSALLLIQAVMSLLALAMIMVNIAVNSYRRSRRELRRMNEELEQRVTNRTADLVHANRELWDEIRERRTVEEELHRVFKAVEQSPAIVVITDGEARVEYVNPRFVEVTGYTFKDVKGRSVGFLPAADEHESLPPGLLKQLKRGRRWSGEFYARRKDGEGYWERAIISAVRNRRKRITHYVKVSEDITGQRLAAEALQESERRFRTMIEQSPLAILVFEPGGRLKYRNSAWRKISGLSAQRAARYSVMRDPQLVEQGFPALLERTRQGETVSFPPMCYRRERKKQGTEGGERWIEGTLYPVMSGDGEVAEIVLLIDDITESRAALQALQHSEERYQLVTDLTGHLIYDCDLAEKRVEWGGALTQLAGYVAPQLAASSIQDWLAMIHEDDVADMEQGEKPGTETGGPYRREYRIRHRNGSWVHVEDEGICLTNESGRPQRLLGVVKDISYRVEAREKLVRAKEEAETANRAKSTFLANMSHELRTPMNAVLGISRMLLSRDADNLNEMQREGLDLIHSSGRRLLDLINDVLDLSRIEAGKMELHPCHFSLKELLDAEEKMMRTIIGDRPITFLVQQAGDIPPLVYTDMKKLNQVLTNVLGNAVKFTEQGRIVLRVERGQNNLFFEVEDTGIGIPEQELDNIFDEFRQGDGSTTRKYGGTGLGLSLCRKFLALMGGNIEVSSQAGKGTLVRFYVPLLKQRTPPLEPSHTSDLNGEQDSPHLPLPNGEKPRLLVVEDELLNRMTFKHMLTDRYHLEYATSGAEALSAYRSARPDLILMDIVLPDQEGQEVLEQLRQEDGPNLPPVIAVSARAMAGDAEQILAYGFDGYLAKPIAYNELVERIEALLAAKGGTGWQQKTGS